MPLDFGLLGKPVNALEALQAYGAAQQMRQQQAERERVAQAREQEARRVQQLNAGLGASINRETGEIDRAGARGAYLDAGDAQGAMDFDRQQAAFQQASGKPFNEALGNAARHVLSLPPEQQSQAWDGYVDQFAAHFPNAAQLKGKFSEQAALAIIAQAGKTGEFIDDSKISIVPIAPGGNYERFQNGRLVPPRVGEVKQGYRFNGGDPANPSSWSPVEGGAGPQTPQTFP